MNLAKENNYWKCISKEMYFIAKEKDKFTLLYKKNKFLTIKSILKTIL